MIMIMIMKLGRPEFDTSPGLSCILGPFIIFGFQCF